MGLGFRRLVTVVLYQLLGCQADWRICWHGRCLNWDSWDFVGDFVDLVLWERGVAVIFVHPLRVALRLHASPSQSEGEGRPPSVSFVGGEWTALLWERVLW